MWTTRLEAPSRVVLPSLFVANAFVEKVKVEGYLRFWGDIIDREGGRDKRKYKIDKSYDDSVKLQRTEIDPFRLG